jgi:hypothetical protein
MMGDVGVAVSAKGIPKKGIVGLLFLLLCNCDRLTPKAMKMGARAQ